MGRSNVFFIACVSIVPRSFISPAVRLHDSELFKRLGMLIFSCSGNNTEVSILDRI